ncbi:U3 snoRNP protein [Entophlyctis sp. JEL0112]|nr:U3 snoRNP protein [Entophlyctis sp. JEL0112]
MPPKELEPIPIDPVTNRPIRGKGSRGSRITRPKELGGGRLGFNRPERGSGRGSRGPRGSGRGRGRGRGASSAGGPSGVPDGVGPDGAETSALVLPQCTLLEIDAPPPIELNLDIPQALDEEATHDKPDTNAEVPADKDSDLGSDIADDDKEDEDDEDNSLVQIEPRTDQERADMRTLIDSFTPDQLHRFEVFRRSRLPKPAVKRVGIFEPGRVPPSFPGKLFIGDVVEIAIAAGLEVQAEWGEGGALSPQQLREAFRRWSAKNPMSIELNKTGGANRYRFQTFSERLKTIKIDALHKVIQNDVGINSTSSQDVECFFIEGLAHWQDLNCTAEYVTFRKEIYKYTQSLEQILYHKSEICDLILRNLDKERAGGLEKAAMVAEPLLNLVTLLARDLQDEFYPHFPAILRAILSIIPRNDAKMLECIFNSIAYLFKYLSKYVSEDILSTYRIFKIVIEDHRPYIRQFGAEAFGFLIRKAPQELLTQFLKYIIKSLHDNTSEDYSDGVAILLFETMKQVRHTLHSRSISILRLALGLILDLCPNAEDNAFDTFLKAVTALGHHITAETSEDLWAFLTEVTAAHLAFAGSSPNREKFRKAFQVYATLAMLRKGSRIADRKLAFQTVEACLNGVMRETIVEDSTIVLVLECLASLIAFSDLQNVLVNGKAPLQKLFESKNFFCTFVFCDILRRLNPEHSAKIVLPQLMSVLPDIWSVNEDAAISIFSEMADSDFQANMPVIAHDLKTSDFCLKLPKKVIKLYSGAFDKYSKLESEELLREIDELVTNNSSPSRIASLAEILCSAKLIALPLTDLQEKIKTLFTMLLAASENVEGKSIGECGTIDRRACISLIMRNALIVLIDRCVKAKALQNLAEMFHSVLVEYLTHFPQDLHCLDAVAEFVEACQSVVEMRNEVFENILLLTASNIGSVDAAVRCCTLRIIVCLAKGFPEQDVQIFQIALECERIEDSLDKYREKSLLIKKMDNMIQARTVNKLNQDNLNSDELQKSIKAPQERLDDHQYFIMLVKLLRGLPNIVEQKSAQILPLYFELLERSSGDSDDADEKENVSSTEQIESSAIRGLVVEYLHVFENLNKPQSVNDPIRLYDSFMSFLSNGDSKLQLLALNCALTWKEPGIVKYADHLKALADDSKFRDSLSTLEVEKLRNEVQTEHQPALMQVLLRILYGKLISRRGRGSSKVGLKARRNAIFAFMVSLDDIDREFLMQLMIGSFDTLVRMVSFGSDGGFVYVPEALETASKSPLKYQSGFLNILEDSIKQLKNHISPVLPSVLAVVLYLMNSAEIELVKTAVDSDLTDAVRVKQLKDIRHLAMLRLAQMFNSVDTFDFGPYVNAIYVSILDSRIEKFDSENTQSTSALMELIVSWSKRRSYAWYLGHRDHLLQKVLGVLSAKNVQETVTSVVVGIFESLLAIDEESGSSDVSTTLIKPNMVHLLQHFGTLLAKFLQQSVQKPSTISLITRTIHVLAQTSVLVNSPNEAESLMAILTPCLRKSSRAISEQLKVDILEILSNFIPILPSLQEHQSRMEAPYIGVISYCLSNLKERASREKAVKALKQYSSLDTTLTRVSELVENLNAYLKTRIDEPDFPVRFDAFSEIGQNMYKSLDAHQWLPILHSMVFSLQDQTEFSVRSSASFCLTKFIDVASRSSELPNISNEEISKMERQVLHVLFPSIKQGIKSNVELVRSEFISLLGTIVKKFPDVDQFRDMVVLLVAEDDEANFFSNIYHMQTHRRIKAMKRLAEAASAGLLSQPNVSNIFLPLVTHVIFEANRQADHNIMNEAINTIAACSNCLSWGKYYALIKTFLKAIKKRLALEKEIIRVVVAILENFKFKMVSEKPSADLAVVPTEQSDLSALDAGDDEVEMSDEDDEMQIDDAPILRKDVENQEQMERIHATVCKKLIPELFAYLTKEDDENVNLRVPVAVAISKLLTKLPEDSMNAELPKLLTTVCQFLKNRLQDVRDGCRDALVKIAKELGPLYFPFIVKELQGALLRGYQLHVLGFSVHHLLVGVSDTFGEDSFDSSIDMLVRIFVNDIFGAVSDEREVEEMHGKLKEMKRTKSFDSFELVCKTIKLNKIPSLLLPLKEIMLESNSSKTVNKIQDILRRIVSGLNSNSGLSEADLLVFVHGLITESLPLSKMVATPKQKRTAAEKRITVQIKRNEPLDNMLTYFKANAYLFVDFGLSILLVLMKRDAVRPNNEEHLKMMNPIVEILAKSLYSTHNTVVVNALKIFAYLVKWPLPALEVSLPAVLNRIFDMFAKKGDASAEKSESSLKLLAVMIKDCPYVDISQTQIVTLISILTPELEEPDRQGAAFSLIRSILNRKYVFSEIYDMMAVVSKIMVTSQSGFVRNLCRQCHSYFVLEFPHGPLRLKKEFGYLIQNLKYEFESGRESVLSFFALIIPKLSDVVLEEFSEMILLSFVMVLVNDESTNCREKSSDLIKLLIKFSNGTKRETYVNLMEGWFQKADQPQLLRTAAQVCGLFIEAVSEKEAKTVIEKMIPHLLSVLASTKNEFDKAHTTTDSEDEIKLQFWRCGYYSLNTFSKIFAKLGSASVLSPSATPLWAILKYLLLFPHTWIRSISCRLFGVLFASVNIDSLDRENEAVRTVLLDSREASFISMQFTKQLESPLLQEDHAKQIVKNLLFLGKFVLKHHNKEIEVAEGDGISHANPFLLKIFKRLAYIARSDLGTAKVLLRKSVFQWFGAMILSMEIEDYSEYIAPAMSVLYRTINSHGVDPGKFFDFSFFEEAEKFFILPEELKVLAKEIAEHIQNSIGLTKYLEIYNKVQTEVTEVREERKSKRKIQAITDPEASAKRREQKNEMKKAGKKRKAEEFAKSRIRTGITKRAKGLDA